MPPPKISLRIPRIMAIEHMDFPLLELPMLLMIRPTVANGIVTQFSPA
jgi:hypothetical protein